MPEEAGWRTTAPAENDGRHPVVLYLGCNVFRTSHYHNFIEPRRREGLAISVGGE